MSLAIAPRRRAPSSQWWISGALTASALLSGFELVLAASAAQAGAIAAHVTDLPGTSGEVQVTDLDPRIKESSGLVASHSHPGILWTHGDSGNAPMLFAVDRKGAAVARFKVDAPNVDWEAIACAPGHANPGGEDDDEAADLLFIADIGNNGGRRTEVAVIVLEEPTPRAETDMPTELRPLHVLRLRYPRGVPPFDAEAMFVHAGSGYIVDKSVLGTRARVFRFHLDAGEAPQTLEAFGTLPIRLPVTGADLSRDGRRLAVATVAGPRVLELDNGFPDLATASSDGPRYVDPNFEAVAITPEGVAATTESGRLLMFPWAMFGQSSPVAP